MDLADALDSSGGSNPSVGSVFPGSSHPTWPGQTNPEGGMWPGPPSQPGAPGGWSGPPSQPGAPGVWPGQPSQPGAPGVWPGQPSQPGAPGVWPGQPSQPSAPGVWPGQPSQAGQHPQPSTPGGWSGPPCGPSVQAQTNLTVPYTQEIPGGLHDGKVITIAGKIKHNPNKLTVDLCTRSDLVFHFNPRFNEGGRKVIVTNSCIGDCWGKEEREYTRFPFIPGQNFEIKITCTSNSFKVDMDNQHLLEFKHRIPNPGSITTLNIYYDLTLTKVQRVRRRIFTGFVAAAALFSSGQVRKSAITFCVSQVCLHPERGGGGVARGEITFILCHETGTNHSDCLRHVSW
ncbi:hypothetical protein LDENG_00196780 [Lucifuga dentata]|nr:hypothetical protein LDENG_00196780 [Lucifuga dentata]